MLLRFEIGFTYKTDTHCVSSQLGDVNRRLKSASQLELVGLNRNDLYEWHFVNELLWFLLIKAVFFGVPSGTLDEETLDVSTLIESLSDALGVSMTSDVGVHRRLIKSPSLGSASSLNERCQVRLWNVKTR